MGGGGVWADMQELNEPNKGKMKGSLILHIHPGYYTINITQENVAK